MSTGTYFIKSIACDTALPGASIFDRRLHELHETPFYVTIKVAITGDLGPVQAVLSNVQVAKSELIHWEINMNQPAVWGARKGLVKTGPVSAYLNMTIRGLFRDVQEVVNYIQDGSLRPKFLSVKPTVMKCQCGSGCHEASTAHSEWCQLYEAAK